MKNKLVLTTVAITPLLLLGCSQAPTPQTPNGTTQLPTTQSKTSDVSLNVLPPTSTTPSTTEQTVPTQENTQNELLFTKVKLAVLSQFKSEDVYEIEGEPSKFVFVESVDNTPERTVYVGLYNAKKDSSYINKGKVMLDASENYQYIYKENLPNDPNNFISNIVLYPQGMDGSKLVLWETGSENSPGPCFNAWIDSNGKGSKELSYIDINEEKPTRKPYVVPQTKVVEANKEVEACEKEISG